MTTAIHRGCRFALCAAFVAFLASLLAASCEQKVRDFCISDDDCGDYRFCDKPSGRCFCSDDRGCGVDEFCNELFMCQIIAGCSDNTDCLGETFCDVQSGQCLGVDLCSMETHCPFNHVCDKTLMRCTLGCRDEGDCVLGTACIGATRSQLGQCAAGVCRGNELCGIQELCNLSTGKCSFDDRGDYCGACQNLWNGLECGGGPNYCLVDPSDASGRSYYCGVDCSQGQACPYGYECHDVIILPPSAPLCRVENCVEQRCQQSGGACVEDRDCALGPPGGDCHRATVGNCLLDQAQSCEGDDDCCSNPPCPEGYCVTQECRGGEGDVLGHCTCTRDLDCPDDECRGADLSDPNHQLPGSCLISGHDCYDNVDCPRFTCIDGGCMIGQNCAPADDRNCRDLVID